MYNAPKQSFFSLPQMLAGFLVVGTTLGVLIFVGGK